MYTYPVPRISFRLSGHVCTTPVVESDMLDDEISTSISRNLKYMSDVAQRIHSCASAAMLTHILTNCSRCPAPKYEDDNFHD